MKFKFILFLILCVNSSANLFSQNLLSNSGFEFELNCSQCPNALSQGDKLERWYSELEYYYEWDEANLMYRYWYLHSPDWYDSNHEDFFYLMDFGDNDNGPYSVVEPSEGRRFVAMSHGELIQQWYSDGSYEEGKQYYITLKIRPFLFAKASDGKFLSAVGLNGYTNATLRMYLSNMRIGYSGTENEEDLCTSQFSEKSDWNLIQNIVSIVDFPINLSTTPPGAWTEVSFPFVGPEEHLLESYDWFAIELNHIDPDSLVPCKSYIGIDDISIMECPPSCDVTSGEMWPTITEVHYSNNPLRIENVANVETIKIEMFPILGGELIELEYTCDRGFPDGFTWDGRNGNGAEVAAATYVCSVTCINKCGKTKRTITLSKYNSSDNPTAILATSSSCPVHTYLPPRECCNLEPVIYLDNLTWSNESLLIHASDEIIAASIAPVAVTNNSNVIFRAGNRIELNPGFSTDNTSYFLAEIVECPVYRIGLDEPNFDTGQNARAEVDELIPRSDLSTSPALYPNPTTGLITYNSTAPLASATVMDLTGRALHTVSLNGAEGPVSIDLSPYRSGTYLLRIQFLSGKVEVHRIIRQ